MLGKVGKAPAEGYAARFGRLLQEFPRADGAPWRGVELERETGGLVSASYVSALRRRRIERPGLWHLETISEVMGFPLAVWWLPPEEWDEELARQPGRVGISTLRAVRRRDTSAPDPYEGILVPPPPTGEELAAMVEVLFEWHPDPRTGRAHDEEDIATRSGLTVAEVRRMRSGRQEEAPHWRDLELLARAFGTAVDLWFADQGRPVGISVEGVIRTLEDASIVVSCGGRVLPAAERRSVAAMMRMARGDPPGAPAGEPSREDTPVSETRTVARAGRDATNLTASTYTCASGRPG